MMETNHGVVRLFTLPQQFPCGPQSSCCGPVGQSEEEIRNITEAIENELGLKTMVISIENGGEMKKYLPVIRLIQSFGHMSLPIITLDNEIVTIGTPLPEEAVSAVREKCEQNKGEIKANADL